MNDNLKKLAQLASENAEVADELAALDQKIKNQVMEETIAIANKHGIALTQEDFAPAEEELSIEELDSVAGGRNYCFIIGVGDGRGPASNCALIGEGFAFW